MTEIEIQRKQGPPVAPILLGLLALLAVAGLIWWLMSRGDDGDPAAATMTQDTVMESRATGATAAAPQEVQAFRQQCAQASQASQQMAVEHEYTADCLRRLADGMDAVIRRDQVADQPLQQRLQSLRQRADQITQQPQATDHANRVRGAAMEASEIIQQIAQSRPAAGASLQQHAQQTRQAAESVDAAAPLLEQRERISRFFSSAADALDAMAQGGQTQGAQPR